MNPFAELIARVEQTSDAMDERDATGFVVVVVDLEDEPHPCHVYGPVPTKEQALVLAGQLQATSIDDGWKHVVLPLFPPPAFG